MEPGSAAAAALERLGCSPAPATAQDPHNHPVFPYGTAIVLPLRTDLQEEGGARGLDGAAGAEGAGLAAGQRAAVLRRRFADLSPTLLLFLQRLRRIVVRDEEQPGTGAGVLPGAAAGTAAAAAEQLQGTGGGSGGSERGGDASGGAGAGSVKVVAMERRVLRQEGDTQDEGGAQATRGAARGQGQLVQLLVHTATTSGQPGESSPAAAEPTLCST